MSQDLKALEEAYKAAAEAAQVAEKARHDARDAWIDEWVKVHTPVGTVQVNEWNGIVFIKSARCLISNGEVRLQEYVVHKLHDQCGIEPSWGRQTWGGRNTEYRPYDPAKDGPIPPLPGQGGNA